MTNEERMAFVRQTILDDVWAGENSTVEDETVRKIVDKWESDREDFGSDEYQRGVEEGRLSEAGYL